MPLCGLASSSASAPSSAATLPVRRSPGAIARADARRLRSACARSGDSSRPTRPTTAHCCPRGYPERAAIRAGSRLPALRSPPNCATHALPDAPAGVLSFRPAPLSFRCASADPPRPVPSLCDLPCEPPSIQRVGFDQHRLGWSAVAQPSCALLLTVFPPSALTGFPPGP